MADAKKMEHALIADLRAAARYMDEQDSKRNKRRVAQMVLRPWRGMGHDEWRVVGNPTIGLTIKPTLWALAMFVARRA